MLSPFIFEQVPEELPVLHKVQSPRSLQVLAWVSLILLLLFCLSLVFTPWQQNLRGTGSVIAFSPLEREQPIETPIKGRVLRWYVQEGTVVKKGDRIADIIDTDPQYMERLRQERQTLLNQQELNRTKILAYELRLEDLGLSRSASVDSARAKSEAIKAKQEAAQRELEADLATLETARLNQERVNALEQKGLASQRDKELTQLSFQKSQADVLKSRAKLQELQSDLAAARAEITKADAGAKASLNSTRATLQEARASLEKNKAELIKLDVQLARQSTQEIRAPRNGTVLKLNTFAESVFVKEGDVLAYLVPDTQQRAVELYMNGNDVPLITPGRHVRLQFEGWPALQFAGWPSVAVGTFAGKVAFIDATDNGKGKFRIVVIPEKQSEWPQARFLRQGVRANGWVLLNQVPLGYELWRQFNGFPPSVLDEPGQEKKVSSEVVKRKAKK
ncbi:transporter [bacterium (Candidatus Blackallbacteria) CG17_big_fil_post_rev_8_21_14_2_50_48_46]|uniref:Transporter n=1 Tax=bacterium (Candidatus Blackallbacteria) CG17_big_fil_post_rev_8_21_14_2_50_48_46 TaxID=2014261 RepID=A0A2M7GB70_9BACT|nr:MAG: transporter [bacterium (Candidatus Blackallbacteria) CG18_big_fil_WC_8_21_14_2_50_49_26]PIW19431.1 MAG: transporter [bacterium (Candidatus Blackallbacteria) CG17_big_fil_post_rev_8_21_14_2_50_48_46]PIW48965.1 MAG: transporter [bacterium (Candidatus Blackallbacteria) CG13_big_fil_rev_8_21_14_2_50_49_14]